MLKKVFSTEVPNNFGVVIFEAIVFCYKIPVFYLYYQANGALGETSDKSDFSLPAWDRFSQEIHDLLLIFYCQKSLDLLEMQ